MSPPLDARCGAVPMPWRVAAWAVAGRCPAAKEVMHVYRRVSTATLWLLTPFVILFGWAWFDSSQAAEPAINSGASPTWQHLSTETGDLPPPSDSTQQVMTLVLDLDQDGDNDFVIGARRAPGPSLVWYRREASDWTRRVIETDVLQLEAGGAFHDIDGDGCLLYTSRCV